jgi:hypothetical protein
MNQQQAELFVGPWDSFLEALRDDVNACGGSKEVGEWFWKEKSTEARRNCVNDRLNAERRDRFTDEQVELIMRRAVQKRGYSAAHWYRCDVVGTERPKAVRLEDEQARARQQLVQAAEQVQRAVEQLAKLGIPVNLRNVG